MEGAKARILRNFRPFFTGSAYNKRRNKHDSPGGNYNQMVSLKFKVLVVEVWKLQTQSAIFNSAPRARIFTVRMMSAVMKRASARP